MNLTNSTAPTYIVTALCAALFYYIPLSYADESITLALGEQKSLPASIGSRFSIGNPEVISVRSTQLGEGKTVLLVKAKQQGYSDLLVINSDGQEISHGFRVVSKKQGATLRDVQTALKSARGLEVLPQGDAWIVRGESKNLADHNLLSAFQKGGKRNVQDLTTISDSARREAEKKIISLLKQAGLTHINVRGVGSIIYLEGIAKSQAEKEIAEKLAQKIFHDVQSFIKLPFEQQGILKFKVQILELMKSKQSNTGFSWSEGVPGILQLHQLLLKGTISLEASLAMLAKQGLAKILSQPEISVNSSGIAELKVGGEIPIPLRSKNFSGIQWKPYGLSLKIEVPGASNDLARTNISVEISSLDHANSLEGIPATKVNRMQTVVDISMGKTIFLSGLIQSSMGESVKKLPVLGDIPILGELFRSKEFQENKSELVMALTVVRGN